ncbi:MAG: VWA domain-containing protein [Deltaproteobacteria bacterium]|nr:VWA domain-containing protein [Deltaproteobacteria bacterium]
MSDRAALVVLTALSTALLSCGAKTGLLVDASVDVVRVDRPDAPPVDACTPQVVDATPSSVELLLLADRSTSMERDLLGGSGSPRRWDVLRDALAATLPRYQDRIAMGLQFFPGIGGTGICAVGAIPDLNPGLSQALPVLTRFGRTEPNGRTPTWLGVQSAGRYLLGRAAPRRFRAILLATDGAPNCNGALDGARCTCTALGGTGQQQCEDDPSLCLDDDRTVSEVARLAAQGVPTYVVGIDGDNQPELITVLSQLAVAGGRPNPATATRPYYSVRRPADLLSAFDQIQRQVSRCVFGVPSAVPSSATVSVTLADVAIARDPERQNGWDWTDAERTTLTLFGAACDRASAGETSVRLRLGCDPPR